MNLMINEIRHQVQMIADEITSGICRTDMFTWKTNEEEREPNGHDAISITAGSNGHDYLKKALQVLFLVDRRQNCFGARILVADGSSFQRFNQIEGWGPSIWIDTQTHQVEGYIGRDSVVKAGFIDNFDLNIVCQEAYQLINEEC